MAVVEIRQKRVENDIETLRNTQSALMDRIDSFADTLNETRDIALANQSRLDRVEQICAENRALILENRALLLENRSILLAIADHLDLTYEVPPQSPQPD